MTTQASTTKQVPKKSSTRASITGGILSVLSLLISALGYAFAQADFKTVQNAHGVTVKSDVVTQATGRTFSVIMSLPFLVAGMMLAGLAIIFTIIRLRKVKTTGLLISVLWLALSVWAIHLVLIGFSDIKAH